MSWDLSRIQAKSITSNTKYPDNTVQLIPELRKSHRSIEPHENAAIHSALAVLKCTQDGIRSRNFLPIFAGLYTTEQV